MKLYFSPGACSLSPHICLREAGMQFDLEQVDLAAKKTKSGADYWKINPKGYVPALELTPGEVVTEGPAIVQYIADQKPDAGLAPKSGTPERRHAQERLNFISSEIHKTLGWLFNKQLPEGFRAIAVERLGRRLDAISADLDGKQYLAGDRFGVADAYLFTVLRWTKPLAISLDKWPNLGAFMQRVASRPSVQAALKAEGIA